MSRITLHSFINSTISAPARLFGGGSGMLDLNVRFLVLEHAREGIILVDGGYGPEIRNARGLKPWLYRRFIGAPKVGVTPAMALEHLGYAPEDIRHLILTHTHADHVCNLGIVPADARIHMPRGAIEQFTTACTGDVPRLRTGDFPELLPTRFIPQLEAIEEKAPIRLEQDTGEDIFGYDLLGDYSLLATPMPGHADFHTGLMINGCKGWAHPVVYGVDAAWTYEELYEDKASLAARFTERNQDQAKETKALLAKHQHAGHGVILCHDDRIQNFDIKLEFECF